MLLLYLSSRFTLRLIFAFIALLFWIFAPLITIMYFIRSSNAGTRVIISHSVVSCFRGL